MPVYNPASYEILSCPDGKETLKFIEKVARNCYLSDDKITEDSAERMVRTLVKRGHFAMVEFGPDITVKFTSNRGFSAEMCRHRLASFAEVSTRYVGYDKDKHGSLIPITSLAPWIVTQYNVTAEQECILFNAYREAEKAYMKLRELGMKAELARNVLPLGLQTKIVVKSNITHWRHIFSMRCSKKAHPQMREVMVPLLNDLSNRIPVVFDDLRERFMTDE